MKRILAFTLTIALLLSAGAFAYNRTEYKKTSKRYWMKAIGQDKNSHPLGSENAYADCELDIDYPGEDGKDHNRMDLSSFASVFALGSGGTYSISAAAYMTYKPRSDEWRWILYETTAANVRLKYNKDNFDLSDAYAKDYFYYVGANAQITNSKGQKFEGHARDFSHGEPKKWVCKDEEGNDNHGGDETCIICDTNITE